MDQAVAPENLRAEDLDDYVVRIDSLGGLGTPGADALTARTGYIPGVVVDTNLDPFSAEYFAQQLALYSEVAGRPLDQLTNEHTPFDIERHVTAINAYDHWVPGLLAEHWLRLGTALRLAAPSRGNWLLDLGCGWGLSSEFMAQSGLNVLAMDVNPSFVELVNRRAARLGLNIQASVGEFETCGPPHPVDIILFYECLHHAPRPWFVLARMATALTRHPGAQFLLAGEPIQSHWWPHWGMRLDAGSIYVMRKYGWFESGWSLPFILRCLAAAGVEPRIASTDGLGDVIAAGNITGLGLSWLQRLADVQGFTAADGTACVMAPQARLGFGPLPNPATLALRTAHAGAAPITILVDGVPHHVPPGPGRLELGVIQPHSMVNLFCVEGTGLAIEAFEWTSLFR